MSKKDKMINRLKSKPRDFTFDEAESLLLLLGFRRFNKGKTSGSSVAFIKNTIKITLHKPHPRKELQMYQIIDILNKLNKEGLI